MSKRNGNEVNRPITAGQVTLPKGPALVPLVPQAPDAVVLLAAEVARMRKEMASFTIRIDTDPISAIEQRCELLHQCKEVADTTGFHLLRALVDMLHEKYCPDKHE